MELKGVQSWVGEHFGSKLAEVPTDYGVARLLTQAGQLGEAVLHKGDVGKELADVVFVLSALANRAGVDMDAALQAHLLNHTPEEFMSRLDRRS